MSTLKYKHLSFEDRCVIEDFLNYGFNFTQIANRLGKNRTTISYEVKHHRFLRGNVNPNRHCCFMDKPPYVCNSCPKLNSCRKQRFTYNVKLQGNLTYTLFLDVTSRFIQTQIFRVKSV